MAKSKVLVLRTHLGNLIICDEYDEEDGRIHIIANDTFRKTAYGTFVRDFMVVDIRKAAMDVKEVVYEGEDWPEDMGEFSVDAVEAYFA